MMLNFQTLVQGSYNKAFSFFFPSPFFISIFKLSIWENSLFKVNHGLKINQNVI